MQIYKRQAQGLVYPHTDAWYNANLQASGSGFSVGMMVIDKDIGCNKRQAQGLELDWGFLFMI